MNDAAPGNAAAQFVAGLQHQEARNEEPTEHTYIIGSLRSAGAKVSMSVRCTPRFTFRPPRVEQCPGFPRHSLDTCRAERAIRLPTSVVGWSIAPHTPHPHALVDFSDEITHEREGTPLAAVVGTMDYFSSSPDRPIPYDSLLTAFTSVFRMNPTDSARAVALLGGRSTCVSSRDLPFLVMGYYYYQRHMTIAEEAETPFFVILAAARREA